MRNQEARNWANLHQNVRKEIIEASQNFTVIDGQAYSTETGENITDRVDVRIRPTAAQREGEQVKENLRDHQMEHGGYVFAMFYECQALSERFPQLTQADLARLMFIGTYLSYDEDRGYSVLKHKNGVSITKKSLSELLKVSRPTFSTFYKKLIDGNILAETDEGLAMNPEVFYRGKHVKTVKGDLQYTRLFRETVRELYGMYSGRTVKKLGLIYAVLPYVNFNFNQLAHNPSEVKPEKIDHITLGELAERLGYENDTKLKQALHAVKYKGKPVFGFFEDSEDRRKKKIAVNPRVIYAGNGKHLDGITALFAQ